MAKGIGIRFDGGITGYKSTRKGMREMMRSAGMQSVLVSTAEDIAALLNSTQDGHYDVGPYREPVTSAVGAHAFVRTADQVARIEQASWGTLNWAIGG